MKACAKVKAVILVYSENMVMISICIIYEQVWIMLE